MTSEHEEIKEALPGYLKNSLPQQMEREVEAHMTMCDDCRNELSLIALISVDEAPDPGNSFWNTLPRNIMKELPLNKRRALMDWVKSVVFYRPLQITTAAAVIILAIFLNHSYRQNPARPDIDYSYAYNIDPLMLLSLDYPALTENDIPLVTEKDGLEALTESLTIEAKAYMQDSYYRDLASLKTNELRKLDEAIDNKFMNGG